MTEPGMAELAPPPDGGGFPAPPIIANDQARQIVWAISFHGRRLLRRIVKALCLMCVMALLLPALIIVSTFALVVARVLGVPLFAASSLPFRHR